MAYIKGIFKKYIFKGDNNYTIGLLKVRENSQDLNLVNKTVTFTGYFNDLNEIDLYKLTGTIVEHPKYGEQFSTESYEVILPEEKDHIIDFLSSELFKGIGEKKAIKIVETLGNDCLNKILKDYDLLLTVPTVTKKQRDTIYYSLENYNNSYKEILNLITIGFSMKDAIKIKELYKHNVSEILKTPYQIIEDIDNITFNKIEKIRSKLGIPLNDINRVSYGIISIIENQCFQTGNTYLSKNEILINAKKRLLVDEDIIETSLINLIKENKLLIDDDKYYLTEVYESEEYIAKRLALLTKNYRPKDYNAYLKEISNENNFQFNEEQIKAITAALSNDISVITGGPGTGKTTIIKAITKIYMKMNNLTEKELTKEIALLAPTGRASKRMSTESNMPSYTIHRFLKWQKEENIFLINEENQSNIKFAIIDEASMLDTNLFYNLLLGLKPNTKILLIGDYNQLPSVGAGQVLKDIIESEVVSVVYLKKLYRQEETSNINLFAHDIINNKIDFSLFNEKDDLTFVECTKENLKENLKDFIVTYKDMSIYQFQILAPIYKGDNGIDSLNTFVQEIVNEKEFGKEEIVYNGILYRENDKILHLVNNIENNVFNGDIGQIINIHKGKDMIINFDDNLVKYTKASYENIKLGYVISIHKAQGSEFGVVILPIINSYTIMLYKKLIYTAVTRAKKRLIILGEKSALKKAILTDKDEIRKTSLKKFLIESINN